MQDLEANADINQQNLTLTRLINHLQQIRDICRDNEWYASASYSSMAADCLFHMNYMGDKAQRPDMIVTLTDVHYSAYPEKSEDPSEWSMNEE